MQPNRRTLLAGVGTALGTALGGCLGEWNASADDEGDAGDDDSTNGGSDDGDDGDGGDAGDSDANDDSVDARIRNEAAEPATVEIRVEDEAGEPVVEDELAVDAGETRRLSGLGAAGRTRTVTVAVGDSEATETLAFEVEEAIGRETTGRRAGYVDVTYTGDGTIDVRFTPTEHHLYLTNLDSEDRRIDLEVVARGDDGPVLEGRYEIPEERGGEFRRVAAWEDAYEVTAALAPGISETFVWEIDPCPSPEEAGAEAAELPDGSRNAAVRIDPGAESLSFVTDSCDEVVAGTEVPTGPGGQFAVDADE